jgi:alpha-mannosidase
MKRRDLLKSLTMVAGSSLCPGSGWSQAAAPSKEMQQGKLAVPVRALLRKEGALLQPVEITLDNHGSAGLAITRVEGQEVDRRQAQPGSNVFEIYLKPVTAVQNVTVTVDLNGATQTQSIEPKPVRQMLIYALPHSHHDLGYTDLQANVEEKQIRNITRGIDLARKTAGYPEGSRFVWNLEVLWGADLYMRRSSEAAKADLIDAVH